jgi:hypothetical protein
MIKLIFAAAVGALFSMDATAGYVRYDLTGSVSGTIIQHDTDQTIAYYNLDVTIDGTPMPFRLNLSPQASEGATQLTYATTHFIGNGPSNFGIYSDFGGDQFTTFSIAFKKYGWGEYYYEADYSSLIYFSEGFERFTGRRYGAATTGSVSVDTARTLDELGGYYDNLNTRFVPTYIGPSEIPEPGSLALLAAGVVGLFSIRRRQA